MNFNRILIKFLALLIISGCSAIRKRSQCPEEITSFEYCKQVVEVLASDSVEGRKPGTPGMEKAIRFVENKLQEAGVQPFFEEGYKDTLYPRGVESYNLVGIIGDREKENDYILVGAHLDHLGKTYYKEDSIYNGANDNATGVAAVLYTARVLSKLEFEKNIIIVVFTAEEWGLLGADHLGRKLKKMGIKLSYMINFEMLGKPLTSSPGKVYISGYKMTDFAAVSNQLLGEEFITYEKLDDYYNIFRLADNYPFYQTFEVPSHTICAYDFNNDPYYHHVDDEVENIDYQHLSDVIEKSSLLVKMLLESSAEIQFIKETEKKATKD